MLRTEVQYPLWPDEKGLLHIPTADGAGRTAPNIRRPGVPSVSSSLHSQQPRRAPRRTISRLWFYRSLDSWLLQRLPPGAFFGAARVRVFGQWLRGKIVDADFQAIELSLVVASASDELGIERDEALRLLIGCTAPGGEFYSDGQIVTLR